MTDKKIIKIVDIIPPKEPDSLSLAEESEFPEISEKEIPAEEPEFSEISEPEEEQFFSENLFSSDRDKPLARFSSNFLKNKKKIFMAVGIICFVVLGFVFYFTLSKAEVFIKPKRENMQFQTELNIDKNVAFTELDNNRIPGQLFQVEKEGEREFQSTQEKELREKAKGTITIYNQYSSAPQTLVKTTRLISEKDKLFRMTKTVVIPGAKVEEGKIIPSSIDIEIEAAEPGEEYNIKPSSFTIPGFKGTAKYTGFYGTSAEQMSGGIIGKVKVVSESDIQGAKDILTVELKKEVEEELGDRIPSNLRMLEDAVLVEVLEASSSVEADKPADKFKIKIKVTGKMLGFDENDAISLINKNLEANIAENKVIAPNTIEISYAVTDINLEKGTAKLTCEVKEDITWEINLEEIRQELAGKNEIEIRQYLSSRLEIENARVVFWPFWVKKIPSEKDKIKITITQ